MSVTEHAPRRRPRSLPARVSQVVESYTTDCDLPLAQRAFRTPLRDERLAAWLGASLGILFTTCFVTGLYSHLHQHPISWLAVPARPAGLYRLTQGVHVASGIASMPVLVAKLWLVWPRFVAFPPAKRLTNVVERIGLFPLVAGGVFMVFSGIANIAQWYPWKFSFTASHFWTAWIVMGAIVAHVGAKWAITRQSLGRHRPSLAEAEPALGSVAEAPHDGLTRRGFLTTVGAAAVTLTAVTVGQTLRPLRHLALLGPRDVQTGPQGRPVNRSAANAGVVAAASSPGYRLIVEGRVGRPLSLTLDDVRALAAHGASLPIACVEGWSYSARWQGVRVRDLMAMAGAQPGARANIVSLEQHSIYSVSNLDDAQAHDPDTLLATHLDGRVLSADHGFPLRLIGPNRPGVNQTKWVTKVVVL